MAILIEIDLSKGIKHKHPDIKTDGTFYLVKISNSYFAGRFINVWFGLSFNGWYGTTYQFDAPGHNRSCWRNIWEISEE